MIVLDDGRGGLLAISQVDHAAACGQLAAAWSRPEVLPETVWQRLIESACRHDDGWIDSELPPALDRDGRPLGFMQLPVKAHADIWRRGIDLAGRRDRYEALLVALHVRYLYVHVAREETPEEQRLAQDL